MVKPLAEPRSWKPFPVPAVIPGPPPTLLLGWRGNALRYTRDRVGHLTWLYEQFGDVVTLVRGGNGNLFSTAPNCPGTVFAIGPQYNQEILSNPAVFQNSIRTSLETTPLARLAAGIFTMNGDKHKQQRRLLMPAFQRKRIESYAGSMSALTRQTLDEWSPGQRLDMAHEMQQLTLRIACKVLFGLEITEAEGNVGKLAQQSLQYMRSPAVVVLPWNLPFFPYRRFLATARRLDREIHALIERKRACKGEGDVLSLLIHTHDENGVQMSHDELIGQANALFMAGHETTSNALTWTLFLLAQHPSVLADVVDELTANIRGDTPTVEELRDLPLLERVLKESMRLLPPVPISGRFAAEPASLGKYPVPQGTEVVFSIYHTHHMPALYPDPNRFLPERWLDLEPSPYEYLPFGAGSRMCLGATFAMLEAKLVLAMLLKRYRPETIPGTRVDRQVRITMWPRHGLPMIVRSPDRRFEQSRTEVRGNVHEMVDLNLCPIHPRPLKKAG
jgi:cytochrome P450